MPFPAVQALVLLVAPTALGIPASKENWVRARTAHFTLVSNADRDVAVEAALTLERFRAVVDPDAAPQTTSAYVPTTIVVFKDEASFVPYKLTADGEPDAFIGKFTNTTHGNYIGMNADTDLDPYGTILHEYVHWMLSKNYLDVPLWLNEGMAELYSTFRLDGDEAQVGRAIDDHVLRLQHERLMPLPELFAFDQTWKGYNEASRRGLFYAESWALCHFMILGHPALHPRLVTFLESLNATANVNQAWKDAFGVGYEYIEAALKRYVRDERFPVQRLPAKDLEGDPKVRVEPLPYADLLYCLGDYLSQATPWRARDAEDHLRQAVREDPSHARARAALASLLVAAGRHSEADEHFRQALDLGRDDDELYFRRGMSLLSRSLTPNQDIPIEPDSLPAPLRQARQMFSHCIALRPNRADAYLGMGATYLFDPDGVEEGIAALEAARNLMPSRMDVTYYLVLLYLRQGDRATAEGLVHHVMARSMDRTLLKVAQQVLDQDAERQGFERKAAEERTQVDLYNDAVDRFNDENPAAALEILDRLLPLVKDAELAAAVRSLRAESAAALQQKRQIDTYNQAITKARAKDYQSAIRILEQLLLEVEDAELAKQVREALDLARSASGRSSAPR